MSPHVELPGAYFSLHFVRMVMHVLARPKCTLRQGLCSNVPAQQVACAVRSGPAAALWGRLLVQLEALWGAINQRSILLPAVFVFLWQARPRLAAGCACLGARGARASQ